jgi:curved DNA-binding protein CbpA
MINQNKNLFEILEIKPTLDIVEIRKAFKKMALRYHPDKEGGNEEDFKLLVNILEKLSDDDFRVKYYNDLTLSERKCGTTQSCCCKDIPLSGFSKKEAEEMFKQAKEMWTQQSDKMFNEVKLYLEKLEKMRNTILRQKVGDVIIDYIDSLYPENLSECTQFEKFLRQLKQEGLSLISNEIKPKLEDFSLRLTKFKSLPDANDVFNIILAEFSIDNIVDSYIENFSKMQKKYQPIAYYNNVNSPVLFKRKHSELEDNSPKVEEKSKITKHDENNSVYYCYGLQNKKRQKDEAFHEEDRLIDLITSRSGLIDNIKSRIRTRTNIHNNTIEFQLEFDYDDENQQIFIEEMVLFLNSSAQFDLGLKTSMKEIMENIYPYPTLTMNRDHLDKLINGLKSAKKQPFNEKILQGESYNSKAQIGFPVN